MEHCAFSSALTADLLVVWMLASPKSQTQSTLSPRDGARHRLATAERLSSVAIASSLHTPAGNGGSCTTGDIVANDGSHDVILATVVDAPWRALVMMTAEI